MVESLSLLLVPINAPHKACGMCYPDYEIVCDYEIPCCELEKNTVAMSSANGLVGTGFVSRYRFQPRVGFKIPNG